MKDGKKVMQNIKAENERERGEKKKTQSHSFLR